MSQLTMPSAVTPALPAVNVHPHGHGHKKGSPLDPTDSTSNTAAQVPVGTAQNLFGSLFSSLQQLIGGQPAPSATAPGASTATAAAGTAGSTAAAAAAANQKINVMA
jgi:hypothetical protein